MKGNILYMEEDDQAYRVPLNLLPPLEAYTFFPQGDDVKLKEKKAGNRIIFRGVTYDDYEDKHYELFLKYLEVKKLKLPENWDKPAVIVYLHSAKFKYPATYKDIWNTAQWRALHLPIKFQPFIAEIINTGFMTCHGRDKNYRPILYIFPEKLINTGLLNKGLTDITFQVVWILEHVIHYMLLPRQVENWIIILDLNKTSLKKLPRKLIKSIVTVTQNHYKGILAKMFVLNATTFLLILWKLVEAFMDPHTKRKIRIFRNGDPKELTSMVHPSQLCYKYGGIAPNPTHVWPPIIPSSSFQIERRGHMEECEYLKTLQENKYLVPRPDMGDILRVENEREHRVPQKIYYCHEGTFEKDQLNISIRGNKLVEEGKMEEEVSGRQSIHDNNINICKDSSREDKRVDSMEDELMLNDVDISCDIPDIESQEFPIDHNLPCFLTHTNTITHLSRDILDANIAHIDTPPHSEPNIPQTSSSISERRESITEKNVEDISDRENYSEKSKILEEKGQEMEVAKPPNSRTKSIWSTIQTSVEDSARVQHRGISAQDRKKKKKACACCTIF